MRIKTFNNKFKKPVIIKKIVRSYIENGILIFKNVMKRRYDRHSQYNVFMVQHTARVCYGKCGRTFRTGHALHYRLGWSAVDGHFYQWPVVRPLVTDDHLRMSGQPMCINSVWNRQQEQKTFHRSIWFWDRSYWIYT